MRYSERFFYEGDNNSLTSRRKRVLWVFSFLILLTSSLPITAYTSGDADTIMDAYNAAFFVGKKSSGDYIEMAGKGPTYFWSQAEEIEGLEDAYDRTGKPEYGDIMTGLLHGFVDTNGKNWDGNPYNDDSMWACIAFARGYLATGNNWFLSVAKSNFNMVYDRAWDDKLGGGLWWKTDKQSKNACVNGPASIAAYLLYLGTGDDGYLNKANDIYNWEKGHLYLNTNGQVYDYINSEGVVGMVPTTYNQGTFAGAAAYLGYRHDALQAVTFTMNQMGDLPDGSKYRILPSYGLNDNNSGFNGIAIRWIARFVCNEKLQGPYLPWLQANAEAAWKLRRTSDNLSWCQWTAQTPDKTQLGSWDCISSVVALQTIPAP